jgi:hypothetical protein
MCCYVFFAWLSAILEKRNHSSTKGTAFGSVGKPVFGEGLGFGLFRRSVDAYPPLGESTEPSIAIVHVRWKFLDV